MPYFVIFWDHWSNRCYCSFQIFNDGIRVIFWNSIISLKVRFYRGFLYWGIEIYDLNNAANSGYRDFNANYFDRM